MNSNAFQPIYIDVYYWLYLGASAILIAALGRTFHRAGGVFLRDAFAENAKLVDAVARLLDIGPICDRQAGDLACASVRTRGGFRSKSGG